MSLEDCFSSPTTRTLDQSGSAMPDSQRKTSGLRLVVDFARGLVGELRYSHVLWTVVSSGLTKAANQLSTAS